MSLVFENAFRDRGLHNFDENLSQPRHRWYPFKEGFSNQLVSEAIESVKGSSSRKLSLLDPFAGSGTTPLVAALNGHQALAIEVNPFCAFTSKVKCSRGKWQRKRFQAIVDEVLRGASAKIPSILETHSTFSERDGSDKWLFNKSVLRAYSSIVSQVEAKAGAYIPILRLAAIRAAMQCCNAKKDGKCLRYLPNWRERAFSAENVFESFRQTAWLMLDDVHLCPVDIASKIVTVRGDSRSFLDHLPIKSNFDLLVTSPPYLNSFDYSDVYRPELFLGGFVGSNEALREIRLQTLRSHLQVKWATEKTPLANVMARTFIDSLKETEGLWSNRIPLMVEAYFQDMLRILRGAHRALRKNGEAWIVVSTSAYGGIHIPVDLILADLGTSVGFKLIAVNVLRQLRSAGQQRSYFGDHNHPLRESLIVLRAA